MRVSQNLSSNRAITLVLVLVAVGLFAVLAFDSALKLNSQGEQIRGPQRDVGQLQGELSKLETQHAALAQSLDAEPVPKFRPLTDR